MIRPLFVGSVILIDINLKIAEGVARCVRCVYAACENIAAVFEDQLSRVLPALFKPKDQNLKRQKNHFTYDIKVKEINDKGIGLELVSTKIDKNNIDTLYSVDEFKQVKAEGSKLFFELEYQLDMAGTFRFGFRMFPKHIDLPHRLFMVKQICCCFNMF